MTLSTDDQARNLRIQRIAKYLRATIPAPKPPPVKHQKSFASLSAEQELESLTPFVSGGVEFPIGTRFKVLKPTNLGVTLSTGTSLIPMTTREWKARFKRVRRATKKSKK